MAHPASSASAPSCRGILTADRTLYMVGLVLSVFSMAGLFTAMVQSRTALITADPYSYLLFAQELARGHLHMTGPLADAIAQFAENEGLMQGPIWNTHVLPDGRTLFTIALGYPLVLSLALQLGGTWLYTQINVLLLLLVVVALTWCVWEGWNRSVTGFFLGAAASILFVHTHPATFLQFSHPWREPLFYLCILAGIGSFIRFLTRGRIGCLVPAGILLGFSCAIKEANAVYTLWVGLCFLASTTWRRHPRRYTALAVFVGCGLLGVAPLLIQNLTATGNPLLSTQFMRATSNYGAPEVAAGLNQNNVGSTFSRYVLLYQSLPAFHPVLLLLAALGVVANLKHTGMRLLLGVFVVHLALYLQWGNADYRHSFFAHIPYSLFVVSGPVWLLQASLSRLRVPDGYRQWAAAVPLLILASMPAPWDVDADAGQPFTHLHANRLVEALDEEVEATAVLLSNRVMRDVLGVYGHLPVIRLHDLAAFHPDGDYVRVIDWIEARGHPVYFLDNRDLDPKNVGRIRWDKLDYRLLLDHYDPTPASVLDQEALHVEMLTVGQPLTVYRLQAWQPGPRRRVLTVPDVGASHLYLNPRSATQLTYRVDGTSFVPDPDAGFYQPVFALDPGGELAVEWDGPGAVPPLHDLRLIAATEIINQDCAADAIPADDHLFPMGGLAEHPENCRRFSAPMVLRVPVRQTADLFTTVGLGLDLIGPGAQVNLFVSLPDGIPIPIEIVGNAAWFPAIVAENGGPIARSVDVTLTADGIANLKMTRLKSIPVHRRMIRALAPDEAGMALVGRLAPDSPGLGPHAWSATVNGDPAFAGHCLEDPRRSLNAFHAVFSNRGDGHEREVAFRGAGLMHAAWISVTHRLEIRAGAPETAFMADGVYAFEQIGSERFHWSKAVTRVQVPVRPGTTGYELVLEAADGHPEQPRNLRVTFGEQSQEGVLPESVGEVVHAFSAPSVDHPGLTDLTLEIAPWSPGELLGHEDRRQLGFMFYGLTWRPID